MSENIELQSFCVNSTNDSDIEEYHEINQELSLENTFSSAYSNKTVKEYDFFTQNDVKIDSKGAEKKKKSKKKEKPSNIMDLISSELASAAVPLATNVITMMGDMKQQQNSCLSQVSTSWFDKTRSLRADYNYGYRKSFHKLNISPIFPKVLENAATEEIDIPVQYVDPTMFRDFIENNENNEVKAAPKFLDIAVKNLKFKHHHTYSLEKMLCVKLVDIYKEYNATQKLIKDLLKDVRVSRETRDNLRKDLLKASPNKKDDLRFDETVRKYTEKLIVSKEKHNEALRKKDDLLHNMISVWADIEMIREKSGRILTPYIFDVTTRTMDDKKFEDEWHKVFDTEFTDLLTKMEYEYVTKYLEYKDLKNDQNIEFSKRKTLTKPKLEINEESLKEEVEEVVNDMVTKGTINVVLRTDENILTKVKKSEKNHSKHKYRFEFLVDDTFVCDSENYITSNSNTDEVDFNESFSVQILPNNKTLMVVLSEDGDEVSFIKKNLTDIRKNIQSCDFIAENFVYNNIVEPTSKAIGSGHNIKEISRANKIKLKSSNLFEGNLYTTCEINMKIGWNEKLNHNHTESIKSFMEIERSLKRLLHGIDKPNIDTLADIMSEIYGKDIENDDKVINILKNLCKQDVKSNDDYFTIPEENSPEFIRLKLLHLRNVGGFTNVENKTVPLHGSQISTDQLKCLQKSDEKEFDIEYINSKYVDADPIELQRFIGAKYVQKLNKNMLKNLNEHLLKKTHKDVVRDFKDLSLRSFFSNKTKLTTLATISGSTKQQILLESLGKEQEIFVTVLNAYNLVDRKEDVLSEDNEDTDRIAALATPGTLSRWQDDGACACVYCIQGFKVRPLRPFVRLSYHSESVQTTTAIGCHPTWNQTLKINTKPEPLSSIYVNVYDEYKANIREGYSGDDGSTVHYRYYCKWLGTLQIPLYSVLTMGMLRGTFKLSTPPILFGYEASSQAANPHSLVPDVKQLMKKDMSFISLQITTNLAHLGGPQGYNQPIPSGPDDDYLIKHLNNFVTEYVNDFPYRNITLTFIDSSGKNKCVTQFLQPIPLPDHECFPKNPKNLGSAVSKSSGLSGSSKSSGRRLDVDVERGSNQTMNEEESIYSAREGSWRGVESQLTKLANAAARYVALIPTYQLVETHAVTLLGLELLKVLHGSPLDHSILLASYFLYLGIKCWVAIGLAFPRGPSSFVLTKYDLTSRRIVLASDQLFKRGLFSKTDGHLWVVHDATTGEHYELRDVSCPLKTVDYVFDNENIWVNVQSSQECENMSFAFDKSSNWQQVFDKTIFVMKQPVVTDPNLYSSPADVTKLRQALEAKIRSKVHKWRPHMKTVWNRYCSGLLREQLPAWEYWSFNPGEVKPGLSQRMKQMMRTYRMFGFPLNTCFQSSKAVVSLVKSTRVHACSDPNAEFALAVDVCAYPNAVLSVWVFLACISRI